MAMRSIKTSCRLKYLYPKDHKGSCYRAIEHAKQKDNCDLSHPIVDLREQISRRPTWESYSKGFFTFLATSGSRVWPVTFIIKSSTEETKQRICFRLPSLLAKARFKNTLEEGHLMEMTQIYWVSVSNS